MTGWFKETDLFAIHFIGCRFFDEETGRDQIYLEGSEWTRRKNGRLEKCSCFEVDGNAGFSCIFTDEDTFLLIADSNQIHKISILDKSVYRDDFVNVPTYGIVALAIDQENNNLYFSDVSFDRTGRVSTL